MFKLLCIDDSKEVQIMVKRIFTGAALVYAAETLQEAQTELQNNSIDLILLDLTLPDGEGLDFFKYLHDSSHYAQIPVIILTSKNHIQDKLLGFHSGAEDYIVKPFDPTELKIRAETRVKHYQKFKDHDSILQLGNLLINHLEQKVTITEEKKHELVELTSTEFKILSYMAKNKDRVLSREQIINMTWKNGFHISDRTIDSHISRIRKKISKSDHTITAIQNVGYKFTLKKMKQTKTA